MWPRYIVISLLLVVGAWMSFDGLRAFFIGDYVTPKSGEYAGRLGPWSNLLQLLHLDPRSTAVKAAHVAIGSWCLLTCIALICHLKIAPALVVASSVLILWYLPFGTLAGVICL